MSEEYDNADFLNTSSAVNNDSSGNISKVVQPKPQSLPSRQTTSAILVSVRQKGNPILNYIKAVPWEFSEQSADYVVGATTSILFLSLKYHRLHPEYIYSRLRQLGKLYNLRILLTMVDITNHEEALKELSKTSMINNLTLVLCWSAQEAGRYLELYKSYEHASPASIRAHRAETYRESLTEFVTTPRNINKTDAASLISNFGSLKAAINAQPEELALVPGWGEKKVKAWTTTVREPFRLRRAARTNIALVRQETSMTEGDGTTTPDRAEFPDQKDGPLLQAIPISSVPSAVRTAHTPGISRENSRPETNHKRSHLQAIEVDELEDEDFDEEEAAALIAASEVAQPAVVEKSNSARNNISKEPDLSDGVKAALAKLRQTG